MIVRYVRERGYEGSGPDPLVTLRETYIVLSVLWRPAPYPHQICIPSNVGDINRKICVPFSDGGPGLFDMVFFDFVDYRIPPDWLMVDYGSGYYKLEPKEFSGDFWDRYHDADPSAEEIYDYVLRKIECFHA
jgi:hypothetical protein